MCIRDSDITSLNFGGLKQGAIDSFNSLRETISDYASGSYSYIKADGTIVVTAISEKQQNITYALGGINSSYNMSAALARVEQKAMLQREADIGAAYNQRTWREWADTANYSGSIADAAKYIGKQAFLKVADATSFELYSRSDKRLLQVRQGQLSLNTMRNANMTEAVGGGAVTLATGGLFNTIRAAGGVGLASIGAGKTAQYYGGLAIAGSGSGVLMDVGVQTSERISYATSGGLTGSSEYDLGQIALSGAIGGGIAPVLGGLPIFANSKYNVNLQSPLYFDTSVGRLNSGIPLGSRSPIKSLAIDNDISIPSVRNGEFANWFNNISNDEFQQIWSVSKLQNQVKARLRSPGGLHEWHLVSRADVFKNWGVKAEQISELRTAISDVKFVNPTGMHGGKGSTMAHNELLDIIDTSLSHDTFVRRLQNWSSYRLDGGVSSLPQGLQPK